jgi:hypothetical protein
LSQTLCSQSRKHRVPFLDELVYVVRPGEHRIRLQVPGGTLCGCIPCFEALALLTPNDKLMPNDNKAQSNKNEQEEGQIARS